MISNIDLFENVKITDKNVIESADGSLPVVQKSEVHAQLYRGLADKNRLPRDVQKEFLFWKKHRRDTVLYVTGARQVGKTTELLKFAYKNYEQIIYVNLAQPGVSDLFERCVFRNDISLGVRRYCREMKLEEFDNSPNLSLIHI